MTAETWLWLSTNDACEKLKVTRRTLQRRASSGRLQSRSREDGATEYRISLRAIQAVDGQWVSPWAAAEALDISPRTLRLWASSGKVERRGSGRSTEYRISNVEIERPAGAPTPAQTAPSATSTQTPDPIDYRPILTRIAEALEGIELALDIGIGVARPTSKGGNADDDVAEDRTPAVDVRAFVPF